MVQKDERPHHSALPEGQDALDGKATAQIRVSGINDKLRHELTPTQCGQMQYAERGLTQSPSCS
jgi:hypothetical protein